ncbi:MAG: hypothetical protein ACR2PX_21285 [Endozoicomonas sp.]
MLTQIANGRRAQDTVRQLIKQTYRTTFEKKRKKGTSYKFHKPSSLITHYPTS